MADQIFIQLSLILIIVLGVSFIIRLFKQPLIISYIISGILIGPVGFNLLPKNETFTTFSEIGIALLLFIVGIQLNPKIVKEFGKISILTGLGQVIITSVVGYIVAISIGFNSITAIYIAVALTFSSTIIIMKLLSDKDALDKLYGRLSIGLLIVQDLIAIVILIIISSFSGVSVTNVALTTLIKALVIFIVLFPLSYYVLPKLGSFFARSQEFLFVFALTWGLGLAALFLYAGLSIEAGALIAGILISMSPYSYEISSKLKPLRDFFIISFFIILGSQMVFENIHNLIFPAIIFSLFILIGNPLIVVILIGTFGYSKNTSFMSGLNVAQISEFSLIMIALGVKIGHLSPEILSFVTLIGLITIAGSTYLIMYSEKIYSYISKYLSIFERKKVKKDPKREEEYEYILFGENRIGFSIMKYFIESKKRYLIVDFNPERVKRLTSKGVNCIYGDASDLDFLNELKIEKAQLIVSTIPEKETNQIILEKVREKNKNAIVLVTGRQISDTFDLYKYGADYVIMPHFLGGEYTSKIIEKAKNNKKKYELEKQKQLKELKDRLKEGHEHPKSE